MKLLKQLSLALVMFSAAISTASAQAPVTPSPANSYLVHNLVSDLPDTADYQDPNLVNPWGLATTSSSPFWIGNNGTGTSTIYSTIGTPSSLVVTIPTPTAATGGAVSGVIANSLAAFPVATGKNASFIFCTEDGTVSGWNSSAKATAAIITVDNSAANAVFKGCVVGGTSTAPILFVTDFHNGVIDMFDANFKPIASTTAFVDSAIPAGYAPFGIANLNGSLYVTYAKQDAEKHDDAAGPGNGFVDVFDYTGKLITHLVSQGVLNSPWGMQIAPASFGQFGGALLVGNFGDGTINAFDPTKGNSLGTLMDPTGHPVTIVGVWALLFGNGGKGGDIGTLYFTAGIPGPYGEDPESHGLFGSIQAPPSFTSTTVVNGASFQATLAPNTWASIIGSGLAFTSRSWAATDLTNGNLPTSIDGVSVTVNGTPAEISFIGPSQVDFLIPSTVSTGTAKVQVINNEQASAVANVTIAQWAPGLFWLTGNKYIAATHGDGALIGPATLISGVTAPALPGETIVLYGTGLNPVAGTSESLSVTIGGVPAQVVYTGSVDAGLEQINVVVPNSLAAGDAAVLVTLAGSNSASSFSSQANAFISVQ